jgi:microsomal epoxide hydrolase
VGTFQIFPRLAIIDVDFRRAVEKTNNSFPNYIAHVKDDDGEEFKIHFLALFSKKKDAVPLLYMHGWPGSHFEHLDIFDLYRKKYSPEDLPYHCIAVSLPGWTLSSGPPLGKDWGVEDTGRIMNKLMVGLGFGKDGYICQGGDIGSFTSKVMAGTYDEVKGVHCECHIQLKICRTNHTT